MEGLGTGRKEQGAEGHGDTMSRTRTHLMTQPLDLGAVTTRFDPQVE